MKSISIILPCYNEEEALPLYFQNVDPIIKEIKDYNFNFILVNDGSKDKTLEVMNELYQKRDDIEIVNLARNFGQNPAIYAGLSVCDSDFAIVMDADLQDPVELIKTITEKFSEGYDVVSPHRANRKSDTWFKRTTAGLFYKFVNAIEGKKVIPENVNAFRGVSRRVVKLFNELPNKDRLFLNDAAFVGFKTCYVDFVRQKRAAGTSKYNVNKLFNHAFNIISSGTSQPLFVILKVGAISSIVTFLVFISLLISYCVINTGDAFSYNQHLTIFFILSSVFFALSVVIFIIGIIGLYLHNVLINTRNQPLFIIDRVVKQNDKKELNYSSFDKEENGIVD